MIRFSANLGFLWNDLPLLERIRRAKACGFDAVEFHYPYDVPAAEVKAALQAAGLPVVGLNTRPGDIAAGENGLVSLPGREDEARAAIDEAVAYAAEIGAGYVHVMGGTPPADRLKEAEKLYRDGLVRASDAAAQHGITVVIEPLNRYDAPGYVLRTTEQAREIIESLGRPNLKILFDCYHAQISEGDLTRRIETLLPIIGHVQIAGVPARAEPDDGEVAFDRLLRSVDAMGYPGFVGAEYRARTTVEDGIGWLARMREALSG